MNIALILEMLFAKLSLMPKTPFFLRFFGSLFIATCLWISPTYAQENDEEVPMAVPVEDEIVNTVKLGGEKGDTASGQTEGAPIAPDYDAPINKEGIAIPKLDAITKKPLSRPASDAAREAFATTRKNARTISVKIPAPRGQITDRLGEPLAQSEVAYQFAIRFGQFENQKPEYILAVARKAIHEATLAVEQFHQSNTKAPKPTRTVKSSSKKRTPVEPVEAAPKSIFTLTDEQLLDHYKHRRWLPLPISGILNAKTADALKNTPGKAQCLELLPVYIRSYPQKQIGAHPIGYVGSASKLPTGPINHNDPLFESFEGRAGYEKFFNNILTGRDGIWRLMFDEEGNKILDELQQKPKPGGAVVTTINLKWQLAAEKAFAANKARRGAMVVIDCQTGEILVMASAPSFDPNIFIPNISQKDYDALRNDPNNPLVSRAFAGQYPPASTFKAVTVLAGLNAHVITEASSLYCPAFLNIGGHTFNNWNKKAAGSLNCISALAMSNNPFMYQIGIKMGAQNLLTPARRLGFGSRPELPLDATAGLIPTEEMMIRNFGRGFKDGDLANMAIGQGMLLATPLQVAHGMAGIANGNILPKLQLIRQILDPDGNVIFDMQPEAQSSLTDMSEYCAIVRKGMKAVIQGGTGSRAAISYASMGGKTGTAQWGKESEERRLAWFAGFMPYENPRFAYAVLYEGAPHEKIGGGAIAAPIVKAFFESIKADVKEIIKPTSESKPANPQNPTGVKPAMPLPPNPSLPITNPAWADDAQPAPTSPARQSGQIEEIDDSAEQEKSTLKPIEVLRTPQSFATPNNNSNPPQATPVDEEIPAAIPVN